MSALNDAVVEARIHKAWCTPLDPCRVCVQELEARIAAALQIHRPFHEPPLSGCTCIACGPGEPYPCPTARALGAQPITPQEDHRP